MFFKKHSRNINNENINIIINNLNINHVSNLKYLGFTLHENLNWHLHIANACRKIAPIVGVMKRLKGVLTSY